MNQKDQECFVGIDISKERAGGRCASHRRAPELLQHRRRVGHPGALSPGAFCQLYRPGGNRWLCPSRSQRHGPGCLARCGRQPPADPGLCPLRGAAGQNRRHRCPDHRPLCRGRSPRAAAPQGPGDPKARGSQQPPAPNRRDDHVPRKTGIGMATEKRGSPERHPRLIFAWLEKRLEDVNDDIDDMIQQEPHLASEGKDPHERPGCGTGCDHHAAVQLARVGYPQCAQALRLSSGWLPSTATAGNTADGVPVGEAGPM